MRKKKLQDERVSLQRRKINSEAFVILMTVLLVSIPIQILLFNAPFEQFAVELVCFIVICIYLIIRHIVLGLDIFGEEKQAKRIPVTNSIAIGIGVTLVNGIFSYSEYAEQYQDNIGSFIAALVITFITAGVGAFIPLSFIGYLNKKKQAKIHKQLEKLDQQD